MRKEKKEKGRKKERKKERIFLKESSPEPTRMREEGINGGGLPHLSIPHHHQFGAIKGRFFGGVEEIQQVPHNWHGSLLVFDLKGDPLEIFNTIQGHIINSKKKEIGMWAFFEILYCIF